jgi:hypothetical protein
MLTVCGHAVGNTSTVESVRAPCAYMMVLTIINTPSERRDASIVLVLVFLSDD